MGWSIENYKLPEKAGSCSEKGRDPCLCAIGGYRTMSRVAADTTGGMLPIRNEIILRTKNYMDMKRLHELEYNPKHNRDLVADGWQQERVNEFTWTGRLIQNVRPWVRRGHGHPNYEITQVLSGHEAYNAYLYRFNVATSEMCRACLVPDTAEHAVFNCS